MNLKNHKELVAKILSDKSIRRVVVRRSAYWFFSLFLGHYIQYEIAPYQQEMFKLAEDTKHRLIAIMAFRGSGKSTIMNLSYPLWAILGEQQKKFVLIIGETSAQARIHFQNIRDELKHNQLLGKDLGPFEIDESNWGLSSLVLPKMGARITVASRDQIIRGIRFWQHRPDLIICDDLESSGQTKQECEGLYRWFMSEVIPAGDGHAKVIVLGNLVGQHSLLLRLRSDVKDAKTKGVFRAYPMLDDNGLILWPGKFPSMESVEELKKSLSSDEVWEREYLLKYKAEISLLKLGAEVEEIETNHKRGGKVVRLPRSRQVLGPYQIGVPTGRSFLGIHSEEKNYMLVPPESPDWASTEDAYDFDCPSPLCAP